MGFLKNLKQKKMLWQVKAFRVWHVKEPSLHTGRKRRVQVKICNPSGIMVNITFPQFDHMYGIVMNSYNIYWNILLWNIMVH